MSNRNSLLIRNAPFHHIYDTEDRIKCEKVLNDVIYEIQKKAMEEANRNLRCIPVI